MKNFVGIKEILQKDPYKIIGHNNKSFDYIIDIGANVGQFSLVSYILFPFSKIFSYEPCKETFNALYNNLNGMPNIILKNEAVGDGSNLYFKKSGGKSKTCTGNLFKKYDTGDYYIKSKTIKEVFQQNKIDSTKNILIKIDCEGGEQYILIDEYKDLLLNCKQLSIEIHFPCHKKNKYNFQDLPSFDHQNNYIQKTFKNTHSILYHCSNKYLGVGVYVIRRL